MLFKQNREQQLTCVRLRCANRTYAGLGDVFAAASHQCRGIFSAKAQRLFSEDTLQAQTLSSPDAVFTIQANETGVSVQKRGAQASILDVIPNPALMEVLWSGDSRYFAITVSDGGLTGTWATSLYSISGDGSTALFDLQNSIEQATKIFLRCGNGEAEIANVGALAWLNKELLVIAEVPPHSSCKNMGQILGFKVSLISQRITEVLSEKKLRAKWKKDLGCRFQ
ncbi:hypothetical protein ACO0LC_28385 [Undibacterium sp. JH2W]|uniref:hypothetical protein n=1 Tax=Undibacterium sp. JH2W TaxID=3413037 RepID=UPI003BF2830D